MRTKHAPLVSIDEAAIILGITRSTAYRALRQGTFPVPTIQVGGRTKVARARIEELIGVAPKERPTSIPCDGCPYAYQGSSIRRPTCSAARRSSSGTESV